MRLLFIVMISFSITSCTHSYYVVRHAEKATVTGNMSATDPPLSEAGTQRAIDLKDFLGGKKIAAIYSTNTIRTKTTAQPTADELRIPIQQYGPKPDSTFISLIKGIGKNVLIVGHSNTIDDIANELAGSKKIAGDLPDVEYDNIFIITYKGKKYKKFERVRYGAPAH